MTKSFKLNIGVVLLAGLFFFVGVPSTKAATYNVGVQVVASYDILTYNVSLDKTSYPLWDPITASGWFVSFLCGNGKYVGGYSDVWATNAKDGVTKQIEKYSYSYGLGYDYDYVGPGNGDHVYVESCNDFGCQYYYEYVGAGNGDYYKQTTNTFNAGSYGDSYIHFYASTITDDHGNTVHNVPIADIWYSLPPHPAINGGWSGWSTCSSSCTQTRTCTNPSPAYGGASCSGPSSQSCTGGSCAPVNPPVNGGWSSWSSCSSSCTQTRSCDNPTPAYGGADCSGPSNKGCTGGACLPSGPKMGGVQISADKVTADGKTRYTITENATVGESYDSIAQEGVMINVASADVRGYLTWSMDQSYWSSKWKTPITCVGGGSAAIYNGAGYGSQYINLISCDTSVTGSRRDVSYNVSFNTNFLSPVLNTLYGYVRSAIDYDGWYPYDTFRLNVTTPPVVSFTATPDSIYPGNTSTLTWSATGADECHAPGGFDTGGAISNSLGVKVSPFIDTTYQLICTGPGGTKTNTVTVKVLRPTVTITANPSRITPGQETTITWNGENVKSCFVKGPQGGISYDISGSATTTPTSQSIYSISCVPIAGGVSVTNQTTVNMTTKYAPY